MQRGDISNQRSFVFGFRCENSLFQYKEGNILDRFLNTFSGKFHRAKVNEEVLSVMRHLYWNTEYTVALIIDDKNYTQEAQDFLADFPFNQVINVRGEMQITMMLHTGELSYYVDECEESRLRVQSEYAVSLKKLNTILKRQYIGRLT